MKALVWLKLIAPVPDPNAIVDTVRDPAPSVPPKEPMFSVPVEPFNAAIVMPLATTDPPLARVRVPPPALPIKSEPELLHIDPDPVTSTLLLDEVFV